jgi:hypothetical protein
MEVAAEAPRRMSPSLRRRRRACLPIMALAVLALLGALVGGLARLGWSFPTAAPLAAFHGPLVVPGFLGTLIGLERAVAVGRWWAYAAPLASGFGAMALVAGVPGGRVLMVIASFVAMLALIDVVRRQVALFTIVMALGAGAWLAGQILWLADWPMHRVVSWWIGFLVLMIAGERLELARLLRHGVKTRAAFLVALVTLLIGLTLTLIAPDDGVRLLGAALVAIAAWLGTFDVARRTVSRAGLSRFIAVALLAGYAWLGLAGALALRFGDVAAGAQYDAILHAFFLGFVFSMIVGHAPMIFPAVLGIGIPYRSWFYVHLALLHGSLVLRIFGDLSAWQSARQWGGLLNAVAIVLFFVNTACSVRIGHPSVARTAP